jgi:hypothetical protein
MVIRAWSTPGKRYDIAFAIGPKGTRVIGYKPENLKALGGIHAGCHYGH